MPKENKTTTTSSTTTKAPVATITVHLLYDSEGTLLTQETLNNFIVNMIILRDGTRDV